MIELGTPRVVKRPKEAERMKEIVRLEVLPELDERAIADNARSCYACSEEFDVNVLCHSVESGALKASGVYRMDLETEERERIGTFFWCVAVAPDGEKTMFVVGLTLDVDGETYYSRVLDRIDEMALVEGCRWVKFGSGRPGIVRALIARGYMPVFVDFCAEPTNWKK